MAVAAPPRPRAPKVLKPLKRKLQFWLLVGLVIFMIGTAILVAIGGGPGACGADGAPTAVAEGTIPAELMPLYTAAAQQYGVPWSVLAAINSIESGFGRNMGPSSAGAMGPMQFLPSTWRAYGVDGNRDGRKDIMDPADAIPGAANYLKASGAPDLQRALFAYNRAQWYVDKVLALASTFADNALISSSCSTGPSGPASLNEAITLRSPREFKMLPTELVAPGFRLTQPVDARIWPNAVWILRTYNLRVTAAREPGHATHGDGTALDMIPAAGRGQSAWDATTGRLAADLGWTAACAPSGVRPTCALIPAIQFVGYDGYPSHGSPRTCQGSCPQHIHVSWVSNTYGRYPGGVGPPPAIVSVFRIGS